MWLLPSCLLLSPGRPTHIPPIARILGIRVGYNGRGRLERAFGEGHIGVGGHSTSIETWMFEKGRSLLWTDGWCFTAHEGQLLEGLRWSLEDAGTDRPRRPVNPSNGWLGKIYPGMPKNDALKIATNRLGKPQIKDGEYAWSERGWSIPYDLNSDSPFDRWDAVLTFDQGRVSSIEIYARETESKRPYPQHRKGPGP